MQNKIKQQLPGYILQRTFSIALLYKKQLYDILTDTLLHTTFCKS